MPSKKVPPGSPRKAAGGVAVGTRLLTSQGWLRVEDLCGRLPPGEAEAARDEGLLVVADGSPAPLVGLSNGGVQPCVRVMQPQGGQQPAHAAVGLLQRRPDRLGLGHQLGQAGHPFRRRAGSGRGGG